MLTDDELLRYSRQILLADIDIAGQLRLKQSRVLIVGLGGLGSPAALYLAAAGVGELHLADFDCVDTTNLQRQIMHDTQAVGQLKVESAQQRLQALNPCIKVQTHSVRLTSANLLSLAQGVDLILDCTDNFTIRDELNRLCVEHKIPWVSGAAIRLSGQLTVFDPRVEGNPCYRCLFSDGPDDTLGCNEAGVLGPLVGVIGSLQAAEAIKVLTGFGRPLVGRLMLADMANGRFRELSYQADSHCAVCGGE